MISTLVDDAIAANLRLGITGFLLFDGTYFLQTIEGPTIETLNLFLRIADDTRHTDVVPFAVEKIADRRFPDWQMQYVSPKKARQIVPDLEYFDFSDDRLKEIHDQVSALSNTFIATEEGKPKS